jgi:hypothetical protein
MPDDHGWFAVQVLSGSDKTICLFMPAGLSLAVPDGVAVARANEPYERAFADVAGSIWPDPLLMPGRDENPFGR